MSTTKKEKKEKKEEECVFCEDCGVCLLKTCAGVVEFNTGWPAFIKTKRYFCDRHKKQYDKKMYDLRGCIYYKEFQVNEKGKIIK